MKYCPNYGSQLKDETLFCSNCGINFQVQNKMSVNPNEGYKTQTGEITMEEVQEAKKYALKPLPSLLSILGYFILFFIIVEIFDLRVNEIFSYIVYGGIGLLMMSTLGRLSYWTDVHGKDTLSKITNVIVFC